ncbi:MAG: ElyC/SanA/YdcF family protein [Campylobacterota bacterium]|nr:ElyC/SanA/YdcF family protein [Campylobacterota bacterium]
MEIGFILKKFITFFIEPLGLVLTLLTIGIYLLYRNKTTYSKLFLSLGFGLLLLFSYKPFSNFLIANLENQYPKYNYQHNIKYIHVLGCGHNDDKEQPLSSQLAECSMKRVTEGIIIHQKTPNSKLVFTGYAGKTSIAGASINKTFAVTLGVDEKNIIIDINTKDTEEEANFMKSIVSSTPFVLVTSATHMPRSIQLFRSLEMQPIPAPTMFYKQEIKTYFELPDINNLRASRMAIHEYIGMLWNRIKG